jgi:hypothetical protein
MDNSCITSQILPISYARNKRLFTGGLRAVHRELLPRA